MSNKNVAIVGFGPTGAFAAKAAYDMGFEVTIYQYGKDLATPPGAFWLHWIPEDVTGEVEAQEIYIVGQGKETNYIQLQWGTSDIEGISSSFPKKPVFEQGYNPEKILPLLVPTAAKVEYVTFPFSDTDVNDLGKSFAAVFQTFPTRESIHTQPERVPFVAAARFGAGGPKNIVVYNGTGNTNIVVREASLFGNHFLEFPKRMTIGEVKHRYPLNGWNIVELKDLDPHTKPWHKLSRGNVHLIGRMAEWDRRCLAHDAYPKVQKILENLT